MQEPYKDMPAPLTKEEVFHPQSKYFHKNSESDVIFNEGVNFKSKEFHAFMLSHYFASGRGGFKEKSIFNGRAAAPKKKETWKEIKKHIYDAALVFFERYPSSL